MLYVLLYSLSDLFMYNTLFLIYDLHFFRTEFPVDLFYSY